MSATCFYEITSPKGWGGKPTGERLVLSQEDAQVLLAAGIVKLLENDPVGDMVKKGVEGAMGGFQAVMQKTIEETIKRFSMELTKSKKGAAAAIFGDKGTDYEGGKNPQKTFGAFLVAVATKNYKALEEMGSQYVQDDVVHKVALAEQVGGTGGFTVPVEMASQLLMLSAEMSIIEQRATQVAMGSPIIDIPALDVTTAPTSGETAFFGGVQMNWEEEASTTGEEEPTFKQVRLQARELKGYTLASNSLLADSAIALESLLRALFAGAIAWYKDRAFLRGTGASQPLGMLNSGALISVTRSAASAFSLVDAANMLSRLLPGWNANQTVWIGHPTMIPKLLTMTATTVGGGNIFVGNRVQDSIQWTLFGIPFLPSEKTPALNTAGDIGLYDCSKYLVGNRQGLEIAFSEHVAFRTNQGAWRVVWRGDGQPWMRSAVTLSDATSTLSPFVALAAG